MRIGLTFDLRDEYLAAGYSEEETAEFDRADTIDAIDAALVQLGHDVDRIGNARRLVERLAAGDRWELVFNICEGLAGIAREAQLPAILDVFGIPYTFSDPALMSLCLDKALCKLVVREAGIATAPFAVVRAPEDVERIDLPYPLFAKPLAEGTGKGITPASKVTDLSALRRTAEELLRRYRQPVLVETFLPGREFTVGLLGTGVGSRVLGTLEICLRPGAEAEVYSYVNKERCEELVEYLSVSPDQDDEVRQCEAVALAAWRALGCRDAGRIDLRSDAAGRPNFLEVNPLAGMHPQHSDLPMIATSVGLPYVGLVEAIVAAAEERVSAVGGPAGSVPAVIAGGR